MLEVGGLFGLIILILNVYAIVKIVQSNCDHRHQGAVDRHHPVAAGARPAAVAVPRA
jgi:hypothetical protein